MALDGGNYDGSLGYTVPTLEELFDELLMTRINAKQDKTGQRVLYEVLDQVEHGRKSMNSLFHSKTMKSKSAIIFNYDNSQLRAKSSQIAHQWSTIERRTISQTTSSTLKIDAPVIFSWTKESVGINDSSSSVGEAAVKSCEDQTTNDKLFKRASKRLNAISIETIEWSRPLRNSTSSGVEEDDAASRRLAWANPNFRVDPLQPFVAKALPKQPKKESLDKKKKRPKSKGLFGFWHSQKKKDQKKTEKSKKGEEREESIPKKSELKTDPDLSTTDDNVSYYTKEGRSTPVQESQHPTVEFDLDKEKEENDDQGVEGEEDVEEVEDEYGDFEQASEPINQTLISEPHKQTQTASTLQPDPSLLVEIGYSPLSMDSFVPLQPRKKD